MTLTEELNHLHDLHTRGVLTPEEFTRAKTRLLASDGPVSEPLGRVNALRRSADDRWLGGVCGGLARSSGIASWLYRLVFALFVLYGGAGLLIYALLWVFMPQDDNGP